MLVRQMLDVDDTFVDARNNVNIETRTNAITHIFG